MSQLGSEEDSGDLVVAATVRCPHGAAGACVLCEKSGPRVENEGRVAVGVVARSKDKAFAMVNLVAHSAGTFFALTTCPGGCTRCKRSLRCAKDAQWEAGQDVYLLQRQTVHISGQCSSCGQRFSDWRLEIHTCRAGAYLRWDGTTNPFLQHESSAGNSAGSDPFCACWIED